MPLLEAFSFEKTIGTIEQGGEEATAEESGYQHALTQKQILKPYPVVSRANLGVDMQRTRAYYDWGQRPYSLTCLSIEQRCVFPARTREINFSSLTVSHGHAAHFMVSLPTPTEKQQEIGRAHI